MEQVDHDCGTREHQSRTRGMVESTGMTSVVLSGQAQSTVSTDRDSESSGKTPAAVT